MKLHQVAEHYRQIQDLMLTPEFVEEQESDQIFEVLDQIKDDIKSKTENLLFFRQQIDDDVASLDKEIARLQALKKVRANRIKTIESYIKYSMSKAELDKIELPFHKVTYSIRPANKVEIDESIFFSNITDDSLVRIKMEIDKTAVKKALQDGQEILGAMLVDSEVLTIK